MTDDSSGFAYIIFNSQGEFDAWDATASDQTNCDKYSYALPRITPDDGTIAAEFKFKHDVWSGPYKTAQEVEDLGYIPPLPEGF